MRGSWGFVAVVLVAAGCGSVESQGSGESPSADTSRFEMVMTRTDRPGRMVMTGLADYRGERGLLQTKVIPAEDAYVNDAKAGDEVRIFGDASFVKWEVKGESYWVEEEDEAGGYPTEAIVPSPGSDLDPKEAYELILSAGGDPTELGEDAVRGQATMHYRVDVDPAGLGERLHKAVRTDVTEMKPFPVDLWVDAENRIRRLRIREEMTGGHSATLTYEFFDFGVEVDIDRPTDDVISSERHDELTRPSEAEMRALCEEEIPEEECAQMEESQ